MSGGPGTVGRLVLDSIDSTNAEAARRARAGEPGPLWILAHRQTAGRGRQGRRWVAPEGNLSATLLLRPDQPTRAIAQLSFAACLAVAEAMDAVLPAGSVALKWPNDALVNGRKAAGVLLDCAGRGTHPDWVAIGVGINLTRMPDDAAPGSAPPTCLTAEGAAASTPEEALDRLAPRMEFWCGVHADQGFAPLRAAWLARAAGLGRRIEARLPDRVLTGIFEDVDTEGALVLRGPTGAQRIAAADLIFPA